MILHGGEGTREQRDEGDEEMRIVPPSLSESKEHRSPSGPRGTPSLLVAALRDVGLWSRAVIGRPLRSYQLEAARGIARVVRARDGGSVVVMMSRQAGKNELAAQLESWLLARYQGRSEQIVKAAPTFKPQVINSLLRLQTMLDNPVTKGRWHGQFGYIIRLGRARILFFSAGPGAKVVGATASILLEVDEAQDVEVGRFDKDFAPMAASTNAPRAFFGTAWTSETLLHRELVRAQEHDARTGERTAFYFPWDVVAESNLAYGRFVEGERARLGEEHPLFRTQYRLLPIDGETSFLRPEALRRVHGAHDRRTSREGRGGTWVAGVDVAGSSEDPTDELARERSPRKDSTVALIGRVEWQQLAEGVLEPIVFVEGVAWWTGRTHLEQQRDLVALLRDSWAVERVFVDASGIGAATAEYLVGALGELVVEPIALSSSRKSELGYSLIAAANGGRVQMYASGPDDREGVEFWHELEAARSEVRPNGLLRWAVPEHAGHDDFVVALALLVAAAGSATSPAEGRVTQAGDPIYSQYHAPARDEFEEREFR